jgi:DNA-binding winged helix-turn-helix (wHTH) protein
MRFRFGECVLDLATRELRRNGNVVHVSPKAFQFLELLLRERPRALGKDAIHERLWPGTFVSDGTLTSLLAEVRSAIGDDARGARYVRTVHRFGYAFSGEASEESTETTPRVPSPRVAHRLFWGNREIALEQGACVLGRDAAANVLIDHKSVSRNHARITVVGERASLEDLGSKNGTSVGGQKIQDLVWLSDGDEIRIGSVPMIFRTFPLSGSTETGTAD